MYSYHIYNQLKKFAKADKSFHVPGHKGRGEFYRMFPLADMDITELSYSDNLFCPDGIIAQAQKDIAEIQCAAKSYILTDGSTCGVLSMLYVMKKYGNKVVVPRNCHQSVWNACRLLNIEPVVVQGECKDGILLPPEPEVIERAVLSETDVAGMVALSPDYYGNIAPLDGYSAILKKHNKLLFIDGAHGAHLAFDRGNGTYAGEYADIWVDGAHKSLPTLTQGAVISANNLQLVPALEEALNIFRTTSPSYPVMASVEYGYKFVANNPRILSAAKTAVKTFKENARGLIFYPSGDWTKLVWDLKPMGICADKAYSELEKRGIYPELSDGRHIIFYLSPLTEKADLDKLSRAMQEIAENASLRGTYREISSLPKNSRSCGYLRAVEAPRELIPVTDAAGRICAVNAGLTPPCIPVIVAGEIISKSAVSVLTKAENTFGTYGKKVWVVKK